MSEPDLYRRYTREEALALFGTAGSVRSLCDGQWVILPDRVLCFTAIGTPPGPSHFQTASRFCWAADKPYRVVFGEGEEMPFEPPPGLGRWDEFLPREARVSRERQLPIHLFARNINDDHHVYIGRLSPSHSWRGPSPGQNFGEAYFDLSPPLSSRVWASLGGLRPNDGDDATLDAALARLRGPLALEERLGILRQIVEYWHGPIRPEDGIPEEELPVHTLPRALRWWYALAGRRRGLLDGLNHLLAPSAVEPEADLRLTFYAENQGGYLWATYPEGDDPPVWGRDNEENVPWIELGMSVSEFLIQACLFEAVHSTAHYRASARLDEDAMARLSAVVPPLPIAPWQWPHNPTAFHAGRGAFLMTMAERPAKRAAFSVLIGSRTEYPLGRIACVLYGGWRRLDWNPPWVDPSWLTWRDGAVPRIARAIREERRFNDLPVLADALAEAGCTDEELLDHCRRPVPHTRGCYVLDGLLGELPDRGSAVWNPADLGPTGESAEFP